MVGYSAAKVVYIPLIFSMFALLRRLFVSLCSDIYGRILSKGLLSGRHGNTIRRTEEDFLDFGSFEISLSSLSCHGWMYTWFTKSYYDSALHVLSLRPPSSIHPTSGRTSASTDLLIRAVFIASRSIPSNFSRDRFTISLMSKLCSLHSTERMEKFSKAVGRVE